MRQSSSEIDRAILNAAAELFGNQGFDRTSVQQIADAVGYSKTGLLHRFPSKQAIRDALEEFILSSIGELTAFLESATKRPDPVPNLLAMVVEMVMANPGVVQYVLHGIHVSDAARVAAQLEALQRLNVIMIGENADESQRFRAALAMELICSGVLMSRHPIDPINPPNLKEELIRIALAVIGTP